MDFETYSFRHAETILNEPQFKPIFDNLLITIQSISDDEIIHHFENANRQAKSISETINKVLKLKLVANGWHAESKIFQDPVYNPRNNKTWRLDFAGNDISIEVAFNHGEAIAWNLLKPVIASELNHVKKAIQTKIGIVICASEEMKIAGGFDSAVGEFEKIKTYLEPLRNVLTVPILFIALKKPQTFKIVHTKQGRNNVGVIDYI